MDGLNSIVLQGMLVGWAVLSPLAKLSGWAPGAVGSMEDGARGWILWVALAVMCSEAVISLIPVALEFFASLKGPLLRRFGSAPSDSDASAEDDDETMQRLVPVTWVAWGTLLTVTLGTTAVWIIFGNEGIKVWATILAFAISSVLSLLGCVSSAVLRLNTDIMSTVCEPLAKQTSTRCRDSGS